MYTKESAYGEFLEVSDNFGKLDKRDCCHESTFAKNGHDMDGDTEVQENWNDRFKVSSKSELNFDPILDTLESGQCEESWSRNHLNSRYVHIPNTVVPMRSANERVQLAKKRKIENSEEESDVSQSSDIKRRKYAENLFKIKRNYDLEYETFAAVHPSVYQMDSWKKFPDESDIWNSTASENGQLRGRFFRSEQPTPQVKSPSRARLEEAEEQSGGSPLRTSPQVSFTGCRLVKENVAMCDHRPMVQLPFQMNSDAIVTTAEPETNREFRNHLIPCTTAVRFSPSFQEYRGNFDEIQPSSDENFKIRDSISFSSSAVPSIEHTADLVMRGTDRISRSENLNPRLAHLSQNEGSHNNGSIYEKGWNAGMSFHKNECLRMMSRSVEGQEQSEYLKHRVPASNVEEMKENVIASCCRSRSSGEDRFFIDRPTRERTSNGEFDSDELWKNMETFCRRGLVESSLKQRDQIKESDCPHWIYGFVDRPLSYHKRTGSTEQRERSSGFNDYVAPAASYENRHPTKQTTEMPQNRRIAPRERDNRDSSFTDMSPHRWTPSSDGGVNLQKGKKENAGVTTVRAKSLSPRLKSNVGSGNFGSLTSIRVYYKTMEKANSPVTSAGEYRESGGRPETGSEAPIDLSRRVQKTGHGEERIEATSIGDSNFYSKAGVDFSDKSRANDEFRAHRMTSGVPVTGSSSGSLPSLADVTGNHRQALATCSSSSLPSSRICSPAPASDSHLPPKKRRIQQSYGDRESAAGARSPADGVQERERMWTEGDVVKPTGQLSSDGQIAEAVWSRMKNTANQYTDTTDLELIEKRENPAQHWRILDNLLDDQWALSPDDDGDLPLHIAVAKESLDLVHKCLEIMYRFGLPVDHYNKRKKTPLHLAVIGNQLQIVGLLLSAGASPNICDRNGDSSIHLVIKYQSIDCLKCLVTKSNHAIDLDARNYEGLTALHLAVLSDELGSVQILLRVGASVDVADGKTGRTPLHSAAETNNHKMAQLLLAYGANPRTTTYSGCTPVQVALANSHLEMVQMLERSTFGLRNLAMPATKLICIKEQ